MTDPKSDPTVTEAPGLGKQAVMNAIEVLRSASDEDFWDAYTAEGPGYPFDDVGQRISAVHRRFYKDNPTALLLLTSVVDFLERMEAMRATTYKATLSDEDDRANTIVFVARQDDGSGALDVLDKHLDNLTNGKGPRDG